jgi:hypothetical protein
MCSGRIFAEMVARNGERDLHNEKRSNQSHAPPTAGSGCGLTLLDARLRVDRQPEEPPEQEVVVDPLHQLRSDRTEKNACNSIAAATFRPRSRAAPSSSTTPQNRTVGMVSRGFFSYVRLEERIPTIRALVDEALGSLNRRMANHPVASNPWNHMPFCQSS